MTFVKPVLSLLFLMVLIPFSVNAKGLDTLIPALLNDHDKIKSAEARRNGARYMVTFAKGGKYPSLDLTANGGREWVVPVDGEKTNMNRNKESIRLTQLLTDFGSTKNLINKASIIYEKTKVELEAARQDVLLKGILAYLNVIKAREKLAYAKKSEASIVKQSGMEETLVKHGAGLSSDILQIKSQLARARALRVSAEGELLISKNRYLAVFNNHLSEDDLAAFTVPAVSLDKMPESLDAAIQTAVKFNPRILADNLNVLAADHDVNISKTKNYPRLNLYAEGARQEDDLGIQGTRKDAVVGAELTYNLFNGFADQSSIRATISNRNDMASVFRENTKLIEEAARNAWQNYLTSGEKHKYLKNQSEIVGEFLELARKERQLGTRSLLDVLSGEVEYINAVSQSVSAEIETIEAAYKIFHAMGDLTIDTF